VRLDKGKLELQPHWKSSDIARIGTSFPNHSIHSTSFFLLTVEESREAVLKGEDSCEAADDTTTSNDNTGTSNGWVDCEVVNIVAESEFGSSRTSTSSTDLRLGSVWVVKVAIRTPHVTLDDTVVGPNVFNNSNMSKKMTVSRESALSGGDLMLLQSVHWSKPLLGIVQPWDPDYDIKFGINFTLNTQIQQSMLAESIAEKTSADLTTANLLICIDGGLSGASSSTATASNTGSGDNSGEGMGGWASPGTIHPGVVFKMAWLGKFHV
jgi:hypothetical protein